MFFASIAAVCLLIGMGIFSGVFMELVRTGLVLRLPTLIVSVIAMVIGVLLFICGLILHVITRKHRQLYELQLNIIKELYR